MSTLAETYNKLKINIPGFATITYEYQGAIEEEPENDEHEEGCDGSCIQCIEDSESSDDDEEDSEDSDDDEICSECDEQWDECICSEEEEGDE